MEHWKETSNGRIERKISTKPRESEDAARDEVWASYRFSVLADGTEADDLKVIDLGAGHATASETLCGRVIAALKSQALLNESPGVGYLERKWPQLFKESGAWPLSSLRQAFLTGSMERLLDPDAYLRNKIPEFVGRGDFGLASGKQADGSYSRVWYQELLPAEEVTFDADVYLLLKARAKASKKGEEADPAKIGGDEKAPQPLAEELQPSKTSASSEPSHRTICLSGAIPSEVWNRLGTKSIPKLKTGANLQIGLTFEVDVEEPMATSLEKDLKQALDDLGLTDKIRIDVRKRD